MLCLLLALSGLARAGEEPLTRIAFGSCANEKRAQPIWGTIRQLEPQLFIFTGDNVYADSADPAVLSASYDKLAAQPDFAALRSSSRVIGTWDDHDFGANDAGAEWEGKGAAKEAFVRFFDLPEDSPVRRREGIYDARIFGPEGRRVQVILLDTRWFRGPLKRMTAEELRTLRAEKGRWQGPYLPDAESDATILGEDQWRWLEEQLRIPAELRLIVSSIQVVPEEHGWEKWGNLPRERRRLLELAGRSTGGVIFLSGDRHTAEISKLPAGGPEGTAYPLFDLTSSGLNQNGYSREPNRHRIGDEPPFGKPNFGWISIDWQAADPGITMQIRDAEGAVVRQATTTLAALQPQPR